MSTLTFRLFGKFCVERDAQSPRFDSKEQELLCHLLLHRDRSHPRETLAAVLWGENSTEKSKKYLRQALWHIQSALHSDENSEQVLTVEHDWVQVNGAAMFVDVESFESAYKQTEDTRGRNLTEQQSQLLKNAISLYRGELLEGCYQDWCLFERERLQNIYLTMLDKLMSYAVEHEQFEAGQDYGTIILRYDRASERTYRRLMQLKYLSGDRTGSLRAYNRCVTALAEELGVEPEAQTKVLWEEIRDDRYQKPDLDQIRKNIHPATSRLDLLVSLKNLQSTLNGVQKVIQRDIKAFEGRDPSK